jgi:hypothetical protein
MRGPPDARHHAASHEPRPEFGDIGVTAGLLPVSAARSRTEQLFGKLPET